MTSWDSKVRIAFSFSYVIFAIYATTRSIYGTIKKPPRNDEHHFKEANLTNKKGLHEQY
jgi:hypothetical protein